MQGRIEYLSRENSEEILEVVNSAAQKYEGAIPEDRYQEPYMSEKELREQMRRMKFHGYRETERRGQRPRPSKGDQRGRRRPSGERLAGVVGVQDLDEVTLIRHLYVRPELQRRGIGTKLLEFAIESARNEKVLVGAWRDAKWAAQFYEKNGFLNLGNQSRFLRRYWNVPDRQVEESVVLRRIPET